MELASGRLSVPECSVLKPSLRQGVGFLNRRFLPHVNRAASMGAIRMRLASYVLNHKQKDFNISGSLQ